MPASSPRRRPRGRRRPAHPDRHRRQGARRCTAADLAAPVLRALADAVPLPVHDVVLGNCMGPGGDVARVAALAAGLGIEVPGLTVDRQCGSGLAAVDVARPCVRPGGVVLAGGVESASTAPCGSGRGDAAGALRAGAVRAGPAWRPGDGLRRRPARREGRRDPRAPGRLRGPVARPGRRAPATPVASTRSSSRSAGVVRDERPRADHGRAAGPAASGVPPEPTAAP